MKVVGVVAMVVVDEDDDFVFLWVMCISVFFPIFFFESFSFWAKFKGVFCQIFLWKTRSDTRSN